jgi:hypothetical protein
VFRIANLDLDPAGRNPSRRSSWVTPAGESRIPAPFSFYSDLVLLRTMPEQN